jgi:hypothetical protein
MLSPSDGQLKNSAKAVSDILEEGDEEKAVMSEVGARTLLSCCGFWCFQANG